MQFPVKPLCFLFIILFASCDKTNNSYLINYMGKYKVTHISQSYGAYSPYYHVSDTFISITPGNSDTSLMLLGIDIYPDANGYFSGYHHSGRLWNDSISVAFMNGGLGGGIFDSYKGSRISKIP